MSEKRTSQGKLSYAFHGIVANRCPSCQRGKVFRVLRMRPRCPDCGYPFEREPGYYLGVIILGYFISCFATVPTLALLILIFHWEILAALLVASAQVLVIAPILIRTSRLIWLYLDFFADPKRHLHKN